MTPQTAPGVGEPPLILERGVAPDGQAQMAFRRPQIAGKARGGPNGPKRVRLPFDIPPSTIGHKKSSQ